MGDGRRAGCPDGCWYYEYFVLPKGGGEGTNGCAHGHGHGHGLRRATAASSQSHMRVCDTLLSLLSAFAVRPSQPDGFVIRNEEARSRTPHFQLARRSQGRIPPWTQLIYDRFFNKGRI